MHNDNMIEIASDGLTAIINLFGAELSHLRDREGRELMTNADPAYWSGRAPLLFPIVGRLADDHYTLDGADFAMPQHGFARREMFKLVEHAADRASFRLSDNARTRSVYPFAFTLDAAYMLAGKTLTTEITVTNSGDAPMPASFGFHPAFAWPLPFGHARAEHRIRFDKPEPGELATITPEGWIAPEGRPSPLQDGRTLALDDTLFQHGALVWDSLESRSVRYDAGEGPALEIDFAGLPKLGIWTRPGAHFVCVEPWHGIADPVGFEGEIWDKPGILRFAPGEARSFSMEVTLTD
ncbi:aldose 1-epimerase family protein [Sphingomonas sp. MMS12-HWE2-04]|uniref:aldose 1-epimerase family protein n=1 Tax=Sphingomonas sp. MMS12-HWE2-04 TaxID=3234199 RepID=UPI003850AFD7